MSQNYLPSLQKFLSSVFHPGGNNAGPTPQPTMIPISSSTVAGMTGRPQQQLPPNANPSTINGILSAAQQPSTTIMPVGPAGNPAWSAAQTANSGVAMPAQKGPLNPWGIIGQIIGGVGNVRKPVNMTNQILQMGNKPLTDTSDSVARPLKDAVNSMEEDV